MATPEPDYEIERIMSYHSKPEWAVTCNEDFVFSGGDAGIIVKNLFRSNTVVSRNEIAHAKDVGCESDSESESSDDDAPKHHGISGLVVAPNNQFIVSCTGEKDKLVKVWSMDLIHQQTLKGHENKVFNTSISPDSKTIVSGSCNLGVWRVRPVAGCEDVEGSRRFHQYGGIQSQRRVSR